MRKQLIILFAVLLAVFAAIGCTTDTEDQPVEEGEVVDPVEEEPTEINVTPPDVDVENVPDVDVESGDVDVNVTPPDVDVENVPDVDVDTENVTVPVPVVDVENVPEADIEGGDVDVTDGEEIMITIDENGFDPSDVEVFVGDTVTWTNEDNEVHTVTADDGTFDSGDLDEGESFSYTFDEAGTYDYGSDEDPFFDGTITVNEEDETMQQGQENGNIVVPATE